jgi:hypothetical protein
MATTTNYSWSTPDDTDLVKDGAAAIRTLGSSIDTTTKNLNPETTLGDIAYRSSTANVKTRLGLGTAGQILAVNSGATAPEWIVAPTTGGMTLLSTTTLSGASTAISVTPTGYINLYVLIIGMQNATANYAPLLRINNDATAVNYIGYSIYVKEQSGTTRGSTNDLTNNQNGQDAIALYAIGEMGLKPSNANNVVQFTVHNPNSTNRKLVRGSQGWFANNDVDYWQNFDVNYRGTSAISSIDIIAGSGTFTAGTVYVYGVK